MRELPEFAFIYGLYDPRQPEMMMYVGKTNNPRTRLQYHKKDAKHHADNPTPVWRWILRLQTFDLQPKIKVLERCPFSEWKTREMVWIAEWREKNPVLLNRLAGGNGSDARSTKEFCDKCGRKRVRLYPSDGSLRCPVCRRQQRKQYERGWNIRNRDSLGARRKAERKFRIWDDRCAVMNCPNSPEIGRVNCIGHLNRFASNTRRYRQQSREAAIG